MGLFVFLLENKLILKGEARKMALFKAYTLCKSVS